MIQYDKIIIGAGIYGLYAAKKCAEKGEKVLVLEYDSSAASRATYVNQARVHNGYHYPRSYSTAIKSAKYFSRFNDDFDFAVNKGFEKIYAISKEFSWTSAEQFMRFCSNANIRCDEINFRKYFKSHLVDSAFKTCEYTFDAKKIKDYFIKSLNGKADILYDTRIKSISITNDNMYRISMENADEYEASYILNASYASINQLCHMADFDMFDIKYELCEIILCDTSENIRDVGITVMDGPFFSAMPFGMTGVHSLTSVAFTPHMSCYSKLPEFDCQNDCGCSKYQLQNCNLCKSRPESAWDYMYKLARKYLNEDIDLIYRDSLFSIKPILKASEIDDSRPTVIKMHRKNPTFVSVLSGKANTIYDLDEVL